MSRNPECHPERAYHAKGMCRQCYFRQYDAKRDKRKDPSEYAPNYRKPPHASPRVPDCHPEAKHWGKGLCRPCYMRQRVNSVKATCHPDRVHVANGMCGRCVAKAKYDSAPELIRAQARASGRRQRTKLRGQVVDAYGGKCACPKCPETNPAFLTLEHINGDGKAHRKKVGSHTYADLRRRGFPQDGYTLLCWNCNAGSRFTGICPHMVT